MNNTTDALIEVGVVTGTHGLRGDLKIRTLPTGDLALSGARQVFLKDDADNMTCCRVIRIASHKQQILLSLKEYTGLDQAKALIGQAVWMLRAEVPALPEDHYYWHDLQALDVIDRQLGPLGRVVGMFSSAAHEILEIDGEYGEVLIPAIPQFIEKIDAAAGCLHVDLPEGLVERPDADDTDDPI